MYTRLRSETIVTLVDGFIHSRAEHTFTSTIVHTSASTSVEDDEDLFYPVRYMIDGECYTVHINEVHEDPGYEHYVDGEYRVSMVQVHYTCPGTTPHYCRKNPIPVGVALGMRSQYDEEGTVWSNTDQSLRSRN